jgi:hypothetical protein
MYWATLDAFGGCKKIWETNMLFQYVVPICPSKNSIQCHTMTGAIVIGSQEKYLEVAIVCLNIGPQHPVFRTFFHSNGSLGIS